MKKEDTQFYQRYEKIRALWQTYCRILDTKMLFGSPVPLEDVLLYKYAGFNGRLDWLFLHIEKRPWLFRLLNALPLHRLYKRVFSLTPEQLELRVQPSYLNDPKKKKQYDVIFFASMNNYVQALLQPMQEYAKAGKSVCIILPADGRTWFNTKRIPTDGSVDIHFMEQMLGETFLAEVEALSKNVFQSMKQHKKELATVSSYQGVWFGRFFARHIETFFAQFGAFVSIFATKLHSYLSVISHEGTTFVVARDRRALEGVFVQCGRSLQRTVHMYNHGLLSEHTPTRFWGEGRFDTVDRIHVWGTHDKEVIEQRLHALNIHIPPIDTAGTYLFAGARPRPRTRTSNSFTVLFCVQDMTRAYIDELVQACPPHLTLCIRLHPSDKTRIPSFQAKYPQENIVFDELTSSVRDRLKEVDACVTYSSTCLLDAIWEGVPSYIYTPQTLTKKYANIFQEHPFSEIQMQPMMCATAEEVYSHVDMIAEDPSAVHKANNILFSHFVTLP